MKKEKTDLEKVIEIRNKNTSERLEKIDKNSKSSKTEIDGKEGSFNYESGQFE